MKKIFLLIVLLSVSFVSAALNATDYYVAITGSNSPTNGSESNPWATIDYAVSRLGSEGGHNIIVKDGTYEGRTYIEEAFDNEVVIKAQNPYRAKLTNVSAGSEAFGIFTEGPANITLEGFIISNTHPSYTCGDREPNVLLHIQDASNITIKNNIIYGNNAPGTCNELLKINRGGDTFPKNIHVEGNLFYDRVNSAGADHLDSVRPGELDVHDNIFFSENTPSGHSFITIKREAPSNLEPNPRVYRFRIYRNIFLNWSGRNDQAFLQFGEDSPDTPQISGALVENNLFIGNTSDSGAAPMQFKDSENITVRANTIVGDYSGMGFIGFRIGTEIAGSEVRDIYIYNNIYSDSTGTMPNFMMTYGNVITSSFELDNNLFWNGGNALPTTGTIIPANDTGRVVADPLIENNQSSISLPRLNESTFQFPSSNTTIRQEFERLARTYGAIAQGSPAIGAADSSNMPEEDILKLTRDSNPDVGAFEYGATTPYNGNGSSFNTKASGGCNLALQRDLNLSIFIFACMLLISVIYLYGRKAR